MDLLVVTAAISHVCADRGLYAYSELPGTLQLNAVAAQPPDEIRYGVASFSGKCEVDLRVTLYFTTADIATAQREAYRYLSYGTADSIPSAFNAATELRYELDVDGTPIFEIDGDPIEAPAGARVWTSAHVESASDFRTVTVGQGTALAVDLNLNVTSP